MATVCESAIQSLQDEIELHRQYAKAQYEIDLQCRNAKSVATRAHGSITLSAIRDSTLVCWSGFPPHIMEGFFSVFEREGRVPMHSTGGSLRHLDLPMAQVISLAREAYNSMQRKLAAADATEIKVSAGLTALAETAASDPSVRRLLSQWVAAVDAAAMLTHEAVVAVGVVQSWLIGE
jgi:hypothetical protein